MIGIISLLETTIPNNLMRNNCGVYLNYLSAVILKGKNKIMFRVCSINGVWLGALSCSGTTHGMSSPLCVSERHRFATLKECLAYLWDKALWYFHCHKENCFDKEKLQWDSLSEDELRLKFTEWQNGSNS